MFEAVLIANRGEIAVRVARACRELGVRSVAVYSEGDHDALHVRMADEARLLGPTPATTSYLDVERILDAARSSGVDAIHPGYGFLAEDAEFARAVVDAGLTFVGPSPEAIGRMGDKLSARAVAKAAGVPVVPGTSEPTDDPAVAIAFADEHGYPVAVKAMFGGGGRGMKVVHDADGMQAALAAARRESQAAFGRAECYLERYLARPRHVEVQILADLDGTVIHLGDRDCSLQRRHQKLVEEAPAPSLPDELRERMGAAAIAVAREMAYTNAGTCEFLVEHPTDPRQDPTRSADAHAGAGNPAFYFLEMNTRLQVEHPVTELVTGIDLVQAQLRIAAGDGMGLTQDDVVTRGHAIEVRINAEDPAVGFLPAPGLVTRLVPPLGPWVRLDTGSESGSEVLRAYDSLIAKLIVWADTRDGARARMSRALDELVIEGIPTTLPFHRLAMTHPQFATAEHSTSSVEHEWDLGALSGPTTGPGTGGAATKPSVAVSGARAATEQTSGDRATATPRRAVVEVDGRRIEVTVLADSSHPGPPIGARSRRRGGAAAGSAAQTSSEDLLAPMQGTVVTYAVAVGDVVAAGDPVVVVEAMKMENSVAAHRNGVIRALPLAPGDIVQAGAPLAHIGDDPPGGVNDGPGRDGP